MRETSTPPPVPTRAASTATSSCRRGFDEALLSGYLDGVLTQQDEQRVRLHLEDCAACRTLLHDLTHLRETTMSTHFDLPPDDQWDEAPRGRLSHLSRHLGWWLVALWFFISTGFGLWQLLHEPGPLLPKLLIVSGLTGGVLLLLSVILDRIRTLKHDRYREVQK